MRFTLKKAALLVIFFHKDSVLDQAVRLRPLNSDSRVVKLQQKIWDL